MQFSRKIFEIAREVITIIEDFAFNYNKYWKNRFTQDVLPFISKGYKLVVYEHGEYGSFGCTNCYAYGIDGACSNCWSLSPRAEDMHHMSYEEFRQESCRFHPYTYETYCYAGWHHSHVDGFYTNLLDDIMHSRIYRKISKGDPNGAEWQYFSKMHSKTFHMVWLLRNIHMNNVYSVYNDSDIDLVLPDVAELFE